MTIIGKQYDDSQFIIEHLSQYFGINMNEHLSEMDKAMARAFLKLVEDSLFWSELMIEIFVVVVVQFQKQNLMFYSLFFPFSAFTVKNLKVYSEKVDKEFFFREEKKFSVDLLDRPMNVIKKEPTK